LTDIFETGSAWGIDIGGSTIILGTLTGNEFRRAAILETDRGTHPEVVVKAICREILDRDRNPGTAGVGIAGLVNVEEGLLLSSPNLPAWKNYPLRARMSEILNCPVDIDNDCNTFALGAVRTGLISQEGLWLMITIGTGIGGTIVNRGSILYGTGFAGEFGHMSVEASGIRCPCGSRGCWERYASAVALDRYYSDEVSKSLTPREMAEAARNGENGARKAFERLGTWLGIGLVNLHYCFSPDGIYLAGGLMGAADLFLQEAREEFHSRCSFSWNVDVLPSSSEAGALGAAFLGRETV
jgi:glucokinase